MSRLRNPHRLRRDRRGQLRGRAGASVSGDHLAMLQYATYFVISPEGCANIIWKTSEKAPEAAEAMGVTSGVLQDLGIVDATIPEPLGGAHRDVDAMASASASTWLPSSRASRPCRSRNCVKRVSSA
jgi:acetyl-CoA carboxylase carboxyl transferase subunit alpha